MLSLRDRLLSDENICLAIYFIPSYLNENIENVLSKEDLILKHELKDYFNEEKLQQKIEEVRNLIIKVIDNEDEYFDTDVSFIPKKKISEDEFQFRPLHIAKLTTQIAMMAMLQVIIYDIDEGNNLVLSEIARSIPSNFYGNKISIDGKKIVCPWTEQFKEYQNKANEVMFRSSRNHQYQYEVKLDLQNFFPSINPNVIYRLVTERIPKKYASEDFELLSTLVQKLLICKLPKLDKTEQEWYIYSFSDEVKVKIREKGEIKYTIGLPQGLPSSYFFGNIYMTLIKDLYEELFPGEMFFYVDDSLCFTDNDVGLHEKFSYLVKTLNSRITKLENKKISLLSNPQSILPKEYSVDNLTVKCHDPDLENSKSTATPLSSSKSYLYLNALNREASNMSLDMESLDSELEVSMVRERTKSLSEYIDGLLSKLSGESTFKTKLTSLRKFFRYRELKLNFKSGDDLQDFIKNDVLKLIKLDLDPNTQKSVVSDEFFNDLSHGTLLQKLRFVLEKYYEPTGLREELVEAIDKINRILYKDSSTRSYFKQACDNFIDVKSYQYEITHNTANISYESLKKIVTQKLFFLKLRTQKYREDYFKDIINGLSKGKDLFETLELTNVYDKYLYVRSKNHFFERMVLNAIYSYLFDFEIDDNFTFKRNNDTPITYANLRVLSYLRNNNFNLNDFIAKYSSMVKPEFASYVGSSLLKVKNTFRSYVKDPNRIDDLILIHKYCADTWKNGTKLIQFYSLYNHDHAVELIQNAVKLLHGLTYLKIKSIDYFILFASCYLHDIAMVDMPNISKFYLDSNNLEADKLYCDFTLEYDKVKKDPKKLKKLMTDTFLSMSDFYEDSIRQNHGKKAYYGIKRSKELSFIDPSYLEAIAEVCSSHTLNSEEVYDIKSQGSLSNINLKFIKIILRVCDALDLNRFQISKQKLEQNINNLSPNVRGHWLSHFLIGDFSFNTSYSLNKIDDEVTEKFENGECSIKPIREKIELNFDILFSQTTSMLKGKVGCYFDYVSKISIDDKTNLPILKIHERDKENNEICKNCCCFMCKWFFKHNKYFIREIQELSKYLENIRDNFYQTEVVFNIRSVRHTDLSNNAFDYLKEFVEQD